MYKYITDSEHHEDIWVTQDGQEIKMVDMEDSHLNNAYNYFTKRLEDPDVFYKAGIQRRIDMLKKEILRRNIDKV